MSLTVKQLREAVAGVLKTTFPDAKVFSRPVDGFQQGNCPDILRPNPDGPVNGWIVYSAATEPEEADPETDTVYTDILKLQVWHFLEFRFGDDDSNSQDDFDANIKAAQHALLRSADLGFEIESLKHSQLVFETLQVVPYGNVTAHVGAGDLEIAYTSTLELGA